MSPSETFADLPHARQLREHIRKVESLVAFPALAVVLLYLATLVAPSAREWGYFGLACLVYGGLSFSLEPVRGRMQAPIARLRAAGEQGPSDEEWREALRCVMRLPREMMRLTLGTWAVAGPFVCLMMWLFGFEAWLGAERVLGVGMASLAGGLATMSFGYFVTKRALAPLRDQIAAHLPDAAERCSVVESVPLTRKLQYVAAGSGIAALLLATVLAYDGARRALVEVGAADQGRVLAVWIERLPGAPDAVGGQPSPLWEDPRLAPGGMRMAVLGADGLPADWAEAMRAPRGTQTIGRDLVTWERLPDGRVAVAASGTDELFAGLASLRLSLMGLLVAASGLCVVLSWLLASDVRATVGALSQHAERIASGDLRSRSLVVSDDELGELAGVFSRMGDALRSTVARVAASAERLDGAVLEIGTVGGDVASSSGEQARRLRETTGLMERIAQESAGVARLAHALGESVEESSSSILELGAAGDELSDTAGVLTERIEEVSTSIEQMVRSVKQVTATSERLADAANDTSSSMEEMASSMRAIDSTAAKTAVLASDVVESSESGLEKVRQTIDGMQSIRDATDEAERVIRGLGARTQEIGAILDVIDDVGDETTLLALNAAIIAAQAGDHGRAFSVVADEIKELAERVLSSTKEIGQLIRAVQQEADNAVGAIEAGSQRVAEGVDLAAEAGVSLEGITRAAAESGQHIQRIVEAVREQTGAAAHVAQLMDSVSSGVDQIRAAGTDQDRANEVVYRSAVTIGEIAQQVRRTTEEQSRGFARIRESVEHVRESVEQIDGSLREQATAYQQVTGFLEIVDENTHSNEQAVQRMEQSMEGLAREAEAMRGEVDRFRV